MSVVVGAFARVGEDFIGFDDLRSDGAAGAIFREKFEEAGVAEVFFDVGAFG